MDLTSDGSRSMALDKFILHVDLGVRLSFHNYPMIIVIVTLHVAGFTSLSNNLTVERVRAGRQSDTVARKTSSFCGGGRR